MEEASSIRLSCWGGSGEPWQKAKPGKWEIIQIPNTIIMSPEGIYYLPGLLEKDNTPTGIFISIFDTLGPSLEIEW